MCCTTTNHSWLREHNSGPRKDLALCGESLSGDEGGRYGSSILVYLHSIAFRSCSSQTRTDTELRCDKDKTLPTTYFPNIRTQKSISRTVLPNLTVGSGSCTVEARHQMKMTASQVFFAFLPVVLWPHPGGMFFFKKNHAGTFAVAATSSKSTIAITVSKIYYNAKCKKLKYNIVK